MVLLQPGSARIARDAATMLLVSRFYFVISQLPDNNIAPFWCRGVIRCKGQAQNVVSALSRLYPDGLEIFSDCGPIRTFDGPAGICSSCGCYNRTISLLSRYIDQPLDVFVQSSSKKRWRISGFPASAASFATRQNLHARFGRSDHRLSNRALCRSCDVSGSPIKGVRRRRESGSSRDEAPKKPCVETGDQSAP